jgi:hypothetical protein
MNFNINFNSPLYSDDLYEHLKDELTKRLLDKEASIRVKAAEACSKLQVTLSMICVVAIN